MDHNDDQASANPEGQGPAGASVAPVGKTKPNWIHKPGDRKTIICHLDDCAEENQRSSMEKHVMRKHGDWYEYLYNIPLPPRVPCGIEGCKKELATAGQRPDHHLAVHGIEEEDKELDLKTVQRISLIQLKLKFTEKAKFLNKMKICVREWEAKFNRRTQEAYVHPWPLDLDEVWPENLDKKRDAATQLITLREAVLTYRYVHIARELSDVLLELPDPEDEEMDLDSIEGVDDLEVYDMEMDGMEMDGMEMDGMEMDH